MIRPRKRNPPDGGLLEEFPEPLFEVFGTYGTARLVGDGLATQVVESEGSSGRETTAPGLIQNKPHQLQRDLRIGSVRPLFHATSISGST